MSGRWQPPPAPSRPELPGGPYLVAGLGRAGLAAIPALARVAGSGSVVGWDADEAAGQHARACVEPLGVEVHVGGDGSELLALARCLVKSPGIRPDTPIVAAAQARGLTVIDEAELGWRRDGRPLVGVTGTNGKSTVASLIAAVLRAAGARPVVAGNTLFGPPLSALGAHPGADVIVAELSSFQLQYCPALLPQVGVLTNVGDDHWDWHGSRAAYAAAKRCLFRHAGAHTPRAALPLDDADGAALAEELDRVGASVFGFGRSPHASCRVSGSDWTLERGSVELELDPPWRGAGGEQLALETRLPGEHNALNVAAAFAAAMALGIDPATAAPAIAKARPVPGRFELVGSVDGVDLIVDYAHNPGGLHEALSTVRRVVGARGGAVMLVISVLASVVDQRQRRAMGRVAGSLADRAVVTLERVNADEPADRPPGGLVEGLRDSGAASEFVPDRRAAIGRALELAAAGDAVVIVNRGPRVPFLDLDGRPGEFDDRAVARELLGAASG